MGLRCASIWGVGWNTSRLLHSYWQPGQLAWSSLHNPINNLDWCAVIKMLGNSSHFSSFRSHSSRSSFVQGVLYPCPPLSIYSSLSQAIRASLCPCHSSLCPPINLGRDEPELGPRWTPCVTKAGRPGEVAVVKITAVPLRLMPLPQKTWTFDKSEICGPSGAKVQIFH